MARARWDSRSPLWSVQIMSDVGLRTPRPSPPLSDLAPHTATHDWEFANYVFTSNPPQYDATCRRCGRTRRGSRKHFDVADCPGRITPSPPGSGRSETRYTSPGDGNHRSGGEQCPDGSWSKMWSRRCRLPMGHAGRHEYDVLDLTAAHAPAGLDKEAEA